jgi:hypothetical protein
MGEVTELRPHVRQRRRRTREEALAASTVRLVDIATIAGVTKNAVSKWRGNRLREKEDARLAGRKPVYDDNCLLAADDETDTWDGEIWSVDRVITWLRATHRMKRDSFQTQRKPGAGRPPNDPSVPAQRAAA